MQNSTLAMFSTNIMCLLPLNDLPKMKKVHPLLLLLALLFRKRVLKHTVQEALCDVTKSTNTSLIPLPG